MNNIFEPKFFTLLKSGFDKNQISKDALCGVVAGILALPSTIAIAVTSGVSPEKTSERFT